MERIPTCKTLTALYVNEKILLAGPQVVEFITKDAEYKILIEQCAFRKITIKSEKEVTAHELYVRLTRIERLLMLFDGVFFSLAELEFTDSDNTSEAMLRSYKNNLIAGRLSYFSSADFCRYSIDKLIDFQTVLTSELFSSWESLLEELDVVHQMYLYSMSDSKLTKDVKVAFLIELAEPLIEVVKKYTNFYASLKPGEKGTNLKMCIDALIMKYGTGIFKTELAGCYDEVLKVMVNSRVRIMHIKREQSRTCFNGEESLLYISKMSFLYRRVLFEMLNIEETEYKEQLQKSVEILERCNDIQVKVLNRITKGS